MHASGSTCSASAVKPRISAKSTVISCFLPCSRRSDSGADRINSAISADRYGAKAVHSLSNVRFRSFMEAVELMASAKVGSVVVVDDKRVVGIFSERDVMMRVVLEDRNPKKTNVEEVMTAQVHAVSMGTTGDEALKIMVQEHIRHLPVV